jgi:hypothetical protein
VLRADASVPYPEPMPPGLELIDLRRRYGETVKIRDAWWAAV